MSKKSMWLCIAALIVVVLVVAFFTGVFDFLKPAEDRPEIQPPSVEDNVEDQRDEVNGDNIAGSDFNDLEFLPQPEDTDKDNTTDTQKPEQDKTPVEDEKDDASSEEPDDKDTEQEKDDTSKPDDTTPPSDSDNSGSGSGSGGSSSSDGSIGTKDFNGVPIRVYPAGTDVNSITPDTSKLIDEVYIGNDVYAWDGFEWFKRDTSVPPNQDSIIQGELGQEMSPFN